MEIKEANSLFDRIATVYRVFVRLYSGGQDVGIAREQEVLAEVSEWVTVLNEFPMVEESVVQRFSDLIELVAHHFHPQIACCLMKKGFVICSMLGNRS
jgi:hypothetical protein